MDNKQGLTEPSESPSPSQLTPQPQTASVVNPVNPQATGEASNNNPGRVQSVASSAFNAADDKLTPLDVPKKINRFAQIKGLFAGSVLIIIGIISSIFIYGKVHSLKDALVVLAFFAGVGMVALILSIVNYKQLTKSEKNPTSFNQFQTATAAKYNLPTTTNKVALEAAVVNPDEAIGGWLGPVNLQGKAGISYQILSKETDNQAINTLVFTKNQVIGLMAGPQDLNVVTQAGALSGAINEAIKFSPESAVQKGVQFESINANHWDRIVANLSGQTLDTVLKSHLNFGLAYSKLQSIEVKNTFINPGLIFHLGDGSKVSFATPSKSKIPDAVSYLKQFVSVM